MKELQELRENILLLKNIGTISKEVELVMLRKLNTIEKQLTIPIVSRSLPKINIDVSEFTDSIYYKTIRDLESDTIENSYKEGIEVGLNELKKYIER